MTIPPPAVAHEQLHASVAGQIDSYLALSRDYAAERDSRRAVLSVWAADVATLQCLLWENGIAELPTPEAALTSIAEAVQESLSRPAATGDPASSARRFVEDARTALTGTFDASVHDLLTERTVPLDHLDELELPDSGSAAAALAQRLDGRSLDQLVAELEATAADCTAVAHAMAAAGLAPDADDQMRMADLATFEAHLLRSATATGDAALISVDLRWDLARRALEERGDGPSGTGATDRELLLEVVGPVEGPMLAAAFEARPLRPE